MKNIFLSIALISIIFSGYTQSESEEKPYVVVVSLDGFRWDYIEKFGTGFLKTFGDQGVRADYMIPSFPTVTFPNHYTLATGLYPDHHGLVHNNFNDEKLNKGYAISYRKAVEDADFYGGEPIWVTAKKQGIRTASYFWVGTEAPIQGTQPDIWKRYEHNFPFSQRVDSVVAWLSLPDSVRPHLVMLYFHEPDQTSHQFGPLSAENKAAVLQLDSLMRVLLDKLNDLPIGPKINLIILSDHGMGEISAEKTIYLDSYIKKDWFDYKGGSNPVIHVRVEPEFLDSALIALKHVPHLKAYKNTDLPERLHYGTNPRVGNLVVIADSSWSISFNDYKVKYKGAHGYDNANSDMFAIFLASGPAFKKHYRQPAFPNVDVYGIITRILKINPVETDGQLLDVEGMFRN
jgi:predicted AlkP superfamily pyrophosphatase or phosphodiesterase